MHGRATAQTLLAPCRCVPRHVTRRQPLYPHAEKRRFTTTDVGKRVFHSSAASQAAKDPYSSLGVKRDSTQAEIKKAYYALAKKFHPDVNKETNAKEKYQEVQDAYDTLSDDQKRAAFDRFGAASQQPGFDPNAFRGFGGGGQPFSDMFSGGGSGGGNPQDIFDSLFGAFGGRAGGSRGGAQQQRQQSFVGEDVEATLNISFLEMAQGITKSMPITPVVDCQPCHGEGIKSGVKPQTCRNCNGSGTVTFVVQSGFTMASTCQACGGAGSKVDDKDLCQGCGGVGRVRERKTIDVKIPPGVEDGMKIKLSGQGDAPMGGGGSSKGGRPGDLYVKVNVTPSRQFRRQGINIYTDVSVPFHSALIGGTVRVPTLDHKQVDVRIPNGTQPGEELVLKGRGVKHLYKEWFGDLVVKFNLTIPRSLNDDQRKAIEDYVTATEGRSVVAKGSSSSNDSSVNSQEEEDVKEMKSESKQAKKVEKETKKRAAAGS